MDSRTEQLPRPAEFVLGAVRIDLLTAEECVQVVQNAFRIAIRLGEEFANMQALSTRYGIETGYLRIDPSMVSYAEGLNEQCKVLKLTTITAPSKEQSLSSILLLTPEGQLIVERVEYGLQEAYWQADERRYRRTAIKAYVEPFGDDELEMLLAERPNLTKDLVSLLARVATVDLKARTAQLQRFRAANDALHKLDQRLEYPSNG
jgi:hypothetical protein